MSKDAPMQGAPLLAALLLCLPLAAPAAEGTDGEAPSLAFEPETGQLSLHIGETPLAEVLEDISATAGIEFIHSGLGDDRVTADFDGLSITEALKRILSHRGYMIQVDPQTGRPARVWVMARKSQSPAARPVPTPATPSAGTPSAGTPSTGMPAHSESGEPQALEEVLTDARDLVDLLNEDDMSDEEAERLIRALIGGDEAELWESLDAEARGGADQD